MVCNMIIKNFRNSIISIMLIATCFTCIQSKEGILSFYRNKAWNLLYPLINNKLFKSNKDKNKYECEDYVFLEEVSSRDYQDSFHQKASNNLSDSEKLFITNLFKEEWEWLVGDQDHFSTAYVDRIFNSRILASRITENWWENLTTYVYYANDMPVGFVSYYKRSSKTGFILFLAVDQSQRNKGYAQKMLQYATDKLKERGCCKIKIMARKSNDKAIALYKKLGFHLVRHTDIAVELKKSLS